MRTPLRSGLVLASALSLLFTLCAFRPAPAAPAGERRVALVVGNGAYKHVAPLANPANDARLIAESLKSIGFELVGGKALTDVATKAELDQAVRRFGEMIRGGGVGVFFYAGHGVQVDGKNFLIPVGADVATKAQIKYELVDADYVLDEMNESSTKVNLVILDACRNNPFAGRGLRAVTPGLATVLAPKGTLIAYSTAPGKTAADGSGKNSPFTESLARHLKAPGQRIEDVFINVGVEVEKATGGEQSPWQSNSLRGVFCLSGACGQQMAQSDAPATASLPLRARPGSGGQETNQDKVIEVRDEADAALRREWDSRLQRMFSDYSVVQVIEKSPTKDAEQKARAWSSFLAAYSEKNPYSDKDKLMRNNAEARRAYWLSHAPAQDNAPPPPADAKPVYNVVSPVSQGKAWRDPVAGIDFVWVPEGVYQIGCGDWAKVFCPSFEQGGFAVHLSGFWLGKYEVTQGQWEKIMGNNPSANLLGADHPVEQVSWLDAKAFIDKLNKAGRAKFRLPTEAEWEYAARSGGRPEEYAGGSDVLNLAWFRENGSDGTHPVGTKKPNGLGLYDMSGNVDEWCEDVFSSHAYAVFSRDNPVNQGKGASRVVRGGAMSSRREGLNTYRRNAFLSDSRLSTVGFRLVRIP